MTSSNRRTLAQSHTCLQKVSALLYSLCSTCMFNDFPSRAPYQQAPNFKNSHPARQTDNWASGRAGKRTDRQTVRRTNKQKDKQTGRQTDRQKERQADTQANREADGRRAGRQTTRRVRQTSTQTDGQTGRHRGGKMRGHPASISEGLDKGRSPTKQKSEQQSIADACKGKRHMPSYKHRVPHIALLVCESRKEP